MKLVPRSSATDTARDAGGNPVVQVAVLLTLAGFGILLLSSVLLHRVVDTVRTNRALVERSEQSAEAYEMLLRDLKATADQRAVILSLRPRPDDLVRFVQGLEAIAGRVFIDQQIAAIPPGADVTGQPYASPVVRYRISLTGTGEKLEAYLRELRTLPELVRIERLEVQAPPDGHIVTNGRADLTLAVAVSQPP